jgi:hypothetical protein
VAKFCTESKYLKYQELPEGQDTIATIAGYKQEVLENNGEKQKKWVLYFHELDKGLALNATNGKTICKVLGTDDMDAWVDRKIALYVKDDVEFGGELVSAIRVRPKKVA